MHVPLRRILDRMRTAMGQRIHISDQPDRLSIAVPILPLVSRIILNTVYAGIVAGLLYLKGPRPGAFIVIAVTGYFALVLGWDSSSLTATAQQIISRIGPIPIPGGHLTIDGTDVLSLGTTITRGAAGRGGRYERYAIQAFTRCGHKPVVILEGFVRESDALSAARTLAQRLNAFRPAEANPVTFAED